MMEIKLTYHLVHQWHQQNSTAVIGKVFAKNNILEKEDFATIFQSIHHEADFKHILSNIDGHFAVLTETTEHVFVAVDRIRTFPIFLKKETTSVIVTDYIDCDPVTFNETEAENIKKIYCTLENETLLIGWQQLQAGEYAIIDKKNQSYTIQSYYRHLATVQDLSVSKLTTQLHNLENQLTDKVFQYAAERTILLPLSGGYDSRYLLALLKQKGYPHIECFTYGKKDSFEVLIAKDVCEALQVKWHFIEYSDSLLTLFFTDKWQCYSDLNHHYTSLPHEQEFFALAHLQKQGLLPDNAVVMNGFCLDVHTGSFMKSISNFDLEEFINHEFGIHATLKLYENSWVGYREWLIKNRLSKFIINSVRVYEYFGLDFYLPFWQQDWIHFWYTLPLNQLHNQCFFRKYLFDEVFKITKIDLKKPEHRSHTKYHVLKKIIKTILPSALTNIIQLKQRKDPSRDINNTLFL